MTTKQILFRLLLLVVSNMALAENGDIFTTYNVFPANAHEYKNISSTDGILDPSKSCFVPHYVINEQMKSAAEGFGEPVTHFSYLIQLMNDGNCQCLFMGVKGNNERLLNRLKDMHGEKFEDGTFARKHKNQSKPQ